VCGELGGTSPLLPAFQSVRQSSMSLRAPRLPRSLRCPGGCSFAIASCTPGVTGPGAGVCGRLRGPGPAAGSVRVWPLDGCSRGVHLAAGSPQTERSTRWLGAAVRCRAAPPEKRTKLGALRARGPRERAGAVEGAAGSCGCCALQHCSSQSLDRSSGTRCSGDRQMCR